MTTHFAPEEDCEMLIGLASVGHARIYVNDELVVDRTLLPEGNDLGAAILAPPSASASVTVTASLPISVRVEVELEDRVGPIANAMAFTFGLEPDDANPDVLIAEAVEAAQAADVALVVVGTNSRVESEGYDSDSLAFHGRQDEFVCAVAAANPHTIVVVNSGFPILLPWRNHVSAILFSCFGGQVYGHALADVLLGLHEPGGRLPTTWPKTKSDVPASNVTPTDGIVRYDEGIHIGFRGWLRVDTEPAYPFGNGLGYTDWELKDASCGDDRIEPDGTIDVTVTVANTGARAGKQVVQIYVERAESAADRPTRWLIGFASVYVDAACTDTVTIPIPARAFAYWDNCWQYEPVRSTLRVGTSVLKLPHRLEVELNPIGMPLTRQSE